MTPPKMPPYGFNSVTDDLWFTGSPQGFFGVRVAFDENFRGR